MAYRRVGIGDSNINPTTIWTPSTGFLSSGGAPPTYVAPNYVAPPTCLDPMGNALADPACVDQLLKVQQQNMAAANQANYNVDLENCLNTVPQPPDCYQRTFGLTPVGGYTGGVNVLTPNAQALVTGSPAAAPAPTVAPAAPLPVSVPKAIAPTQTPARTTGGSGESGGSGSGGGDGSGGGYVAPQTGFFSESFAIDGFNIPLWGLLAVGAAALLLFKGGR